MGWFLQRVEPNATAPPAKQYLAKDQIHIGRAKESDINCVSIHVSRHHAKITFKNNHPFVTDLGSSNGTYVNKNRIKKNAESRLVNGDIIGFGYAEVNTDPSCFVYQIFRECESEEQASSRTSFNSGQNSSNSPQPGFAEVARTICSSEPSSTVGIKRRIEVIDLSDDECRQIPFKKEKLAAEECEPSHSKTSFRKQSQVSINSDISHQVSDSTSSKPSKKENSKPDSSTKKNSKPDPSIKENGKPDLSIKENSKPDSLIKKNDKPDSSITENSKPDSSNRDISKPESSKKDCSKTDSCKEGSSKSKSSKKASSNSDSSKKASSNSDSSKKASSNSDSLKKASSNSDSLKKASSNSDSLKKASSNSDSLKKESSKPDWSKKENGKPDSLKKSEFSNSKTRDLSLYEMDYCTPSKALKKESKEIERINDTSTHVSKRPSNAVDISIGDVFLMRPSNEEEKSTVLNTSAISSDRSDTSRSKLSTLGESVAKSSHIPSTSKGIHWREMDSKSMDFSDCGRSVEDPSSDSSRLVIDEDVSCRHSSFKDCSQVKTPVDSVRNPRVASLIKSACATSTPHSKIGSRTSSETPLRSLTATMSPIPSRRTPSPLLDFGEEKEIRVKEEPVENKERNSFTYTLEEDVIVLSDDGEDFPNSQLFDDERPSPSRVENIGDEENVAKPLPEEEERVQEVASPLLEDSDSDSDSVDIKWMNKLSQSQSFIKTEPLDEPEKIPEPEEGPEPEEIPEPEEAPEPEEIPESEEPTVSDITTSVQNESTRDSRRESIGAAEPVASVTPASRTGSRRSTGPEVIDAPPMPRRRAHLRGISVQTANFLQQNIWSKDRSVSGDRGKTERTRKREELPKKKVSVKEGRRARLKEISEKKRAETSLEETSRSGKKGTAKVKVTEKLRGSFLTEMSDSVEAGKRTKVPSRQAVLQMKQIPKLKQAEASRPRTVSPLENLNMSFDRYKPQRNGVPPREGLPAAAVCRPTAQVAPRVAPCVAPRVQIPETVTTGLLSAPTDNAPDSVLRSCLKMPTGKQEIAVYMEGLPKKRVRFREILADVREIEALETTKPANKAKDAPISAYAIQDRLPRTRSPDLSFVANDVLKDIFQWKTKWLDEYLRFKDMNPQNMPDDPPAQGTRQIGPLPSEFVSYDEYFNKMYPLLLIELWNGVAREWDSLRDRRRPLTHEVKIDDVNEDQTLIRVSCHTVYRNEHECPKMGDLVVCEFVANPPPVAAGNPAPKAMVIDAFGYIESENRKRHVQGADEMLVIRSPGARNVVRLTVLMKNRNVQIVKDKLMRMKVVKYIRSELRNFQALTHFKTLSVCPSVLSPKADSSAFEIRQPKLSGSEIVVEDDLNPSQQQAILHTTEACSMDEPKICVIQGPPGTGKSRVTTCLVLQLLYRVVEYDKANREKKAIPKILLCAPSNAAVDVLVMRLLEERQRLPREKRFKMVRVGRLETMHPKVRDISLQELAKRDACFQANVDVASVETELRTTEAKLRASENALKASKASRGQDSERAQEVQELKRRMSVLQNRVEQRVTEVNPGAKRESSKKLLRNADIIATTLSSCFTKIMETVFSPSSCGEFNFTCCIIDEATQCMEVQTLTPLILGVKTLVLVGDPKQLSATVLSQKARNCGLGTSLFGRVIPLLPQAVQFLDTQYRMHPEIISWPNRYFYNGRLKSPESLIDGRVSPLVPYAVISTPFRQDGDRKEVNSEEAKFVITLAAVMVQKLLESLTTEHNLSIGIITPYQKQKQLLIGLLQERYPQYQRLQEIIDINTFDSFQGQEKDVIIMSCVRTDKIGFLNDPQRLNVALTRARFSLLICGNFGALYGDEMWSNLLQDARTRGLIKDIRGRSSERELWSLVSLQMNW